MTSTVVGSLVALALIAIVASTQYRTWQRWQRRARRNASLDAILAGTGAQVAALDAPAAAAPAVAVATPTNPIDRMALWLRQRRGARKLMSAAVGVLVVAALLIISYPFLTDLYQNKLQNHLRNQLGSDSLKNA